MAQGGGQHRARGKVSAMAPGAGGPHVKGEGSTISTTRLGGAVAAAALSNGVAVAARFRKWRRGRRCARAAQRTSARPSATGGSVSAGGREQMPLAAAVCHTAQLTRHCQLQRSAHRHAADTCGGGHPRLPPAPLGRPRPSRRAGLAVEHVGHPLAVQTLTAGYLTGGGQRQSRCRVRFTTPRPSGFPEENANSRGGISCHPLPAMP